MKPGRKTQQRNSRSEPVKIALAFDDAMRAIVRVQPKSRSEETGVSDAGKHPD